MTGWKSANGLGNSLAYDGDLRPTSITVPNVESLAFTYDAANRITGIANGMNGNASQALGYDALGRLNSVTSGVQTASYGYDADGNTTTINGSTAYGYGPFNRLVNASGASFVISAEGQRLAKSFGGATTYFAPGGGGAMLAEDDAGSWVDYVWLNGRLVSLVKSGSVYSIHDDQTGRPIAVTAPSSQAVVWAAAGLPFDRQVTANTFGDFNIGFPGQYFDSEDGLYHNGARDYDAALGRFIESDPMGLGGGVNSFAYAGGNPISNIDVTGMTHHHYSQTLWTACSPDSQLDELKWPEMSGPEAPAARNGFTPNIPLASFRPDRHNYIDQRVDPCNRTITNTTDKGHIFDPGKVTLQVTPGPFGGSYYTYTGDGDGQDPGFNDVVGRLYFGGVVGGISAVTCAYRRAWSTIF
jgi:RHS repeat-associated protein